MPNNKNLVLPAVLSKFQSTFGYAPILILGSVAAKAISDISVPINVRAVSISTIDPAIYISWDCNAVSRRGPIVGRLITCPTIKSPPNKVARFHPAVLIKGFRAILVGYFRINLNSDMPLLLAAST